jgi:hypothetical protein
MPSCRKTAALWIVLLFLVACSSPIYAQGLRPGGALTIGRLSRKAGYIFLGTVLSVERIEPSSPTGVASMRVSFHIDEGIRGVRTGEVLTVREWVGLWESGERYRRGEQVVLFLYPPSKLGLTSTVGGPAGRLAVDRDGYVEVDPLGHGALANERDQNKEKSRMSTRELARAIRGAEED